MSKSNEPFREETMRKFEISNTSVQLEKGTVWIYNYGEVKVHAYETKDFFDTTVLLFEKNGQALIFEAPPIKDNFDELREYIVDLGHSEVEMIVSYHPIGTTFTDTNKLKFTNIYSMQHAVDNYVSGPGAGSLPMLKERFGKAFDETIFTDAIMLEEGENEIAGIKFIMRNVDFAFDAEIPELNVAHVHFLGHDRHTLVFSYEFLEAYIAQLERIQDRGYHMIFPTHGSAETQGDVTLKLKYLYALKKIAEASGNKDEFLKRMNKTYPNLGWPFYLEGTANFLFEEKK